MLMRIGMDGRRDSTTIRYACIIFQHHLYFTLQRKSSDETPCPLGWPERSSSSLRLVVPSLLLRGNGELELTFRVPLKAFKRRERLPKEACISIYN